MVSPLTISSGNNVLQHTDLLGSTFTALVFAKLHKEKKINP
jgi:hypothetical protein